MIQDQFFMPTKNHHEHFTQACKPLTDYFGINSSRYIDIDKNGKAYSMYTNYKCAERYLEKDFCKIDLNFVTPENMSSGISFSFASNDKNFRDIYIHDCVTVFEIHHSFEYVIKTPGGGYYNYGFSTTKDNGAIYQKIINEYDIFEKMVNTLHKKNMDLLENELEESRIVFADLKGDEFYTQTGSVFISAEEQAKKICNLKKEGYIDQNDDFAFNLTPQEICCLKSYMNNNHINSVAADLKLTYSTASSYMENIKRKLNCNNKTSLLQKAELLKSLSFI